MKALLVKVLLMVLVLLVPTLGVAFDVSVANICAGIAKGFFFVVPIVLMVSSAIGLISRY